LGLGEALVFYGRQQGDRLLELYRQTPARNRILQEYDLTANSGRFGELLRGWLGGLGGGQPASAGCLTGTGEGARR